MIGIMFSLVAYAILMIFSPKIDWRISKKNGHFIVQYKQKFNPFWQTLCDAIIVRDECGKSLGMHYIDIYLADEETAQAYLDHYREHDCFPPYYTEQKGSVIKGILAERKEEKENIEHRDLIPIDEEPKYGGTDDHGQNMWHVGNSMVTELVLKKYMCYRLEKSGRWSKPSPFKIDVSNMKRADLKEEAKRLSRSIDYNSETGEINPPKKD